MALIERYVLGVAGFKVGDMVVAVADFQRMAQQG
jgi:hypothetical protein